MPLLLSTAQTLSQNDLERGVIETIIYRDDLFAFLPFVGINGKAYVYNRENSMSGADWVSPNAVVNESAADVSELTTTLKIIVGDVDVDKFIDSTMSDQTSQMSFQIQAKAKAVAQMYHTALAAGDSTANALSFDGLPNLCDPNYTTVAATNGAAISLSMLDTLKDMVILGADALVMRRGTWRAIKQLMRAAGGIQPQMMQMENFGVTVPAFDGTPVLLNDFLSPTETCGTSSATCSVYAVRMNEFDGLHGIYGGGPAGLVVENIGTVQNKDANRVRVKWYTSLVLKSNRSLARLSGITSV